MKLYKFNYVDIVEDTQGNQYELSMFSEITGLTIAEIESSCEIIDEQY